MSTLEEMPVCSVLEGYDEWGLIIEKANPHLGPQHGVIIIKNPLLQRPNKKRKSPKWLPPSSLNSTS